MLELPLGMPQEHRRIFLGERHEVLPQGCGVEDVGFEEGPIARPGGWKVLGQIRRCRTRKVLVGREELSGQSRCSEGVVSAEGQVRCCRVCSCSMVVEGLAQVCLKDERISYQFEHR